MRGHLLFKLPMSCSAVRWFVWLCLLILFTGATMQAEQPRQADVPVKNAARSGGISSTVTARQFNMASHPLRSFDNLPMTFARQTTPRGQRFVANGLDYSLVLDKTGLSIEADQAVAPAQKTTPVAVTAYKARFAPHQCGRRIARTSRVHVEFLGTSPAVRMEGLGKAKAKANYFLGSNPALWQTGLPTYERVRYSHLYPGVDLIYYRGMKRKFEYDLVVKPGADPLKIRFRVDGSQRAVIGSDGNLYLDGAHGLILLNRPVLYQDLADGKKVTFGSFRQIAKNEFGFAPIHYDHSKPLIIDPTISLLYSTFVGGVDDEEDYGMSVDAAGDVYLVGASASPNFPVTANAHQTTYTGIDVYHAVIVKFDPSGAVLYSTFLGGTGNDFGDAIAVTLSGDAWIGGTTNSSDFPVTSGAYQSTPGSIFLSEISPDGSSLLYSTYLGSTGVDSINDILLNSDGSMWISGGGGSPGLPASANAYQKSPNGTDNDFVAKITFSSTGALQIPYLTYFGGSNQSESAMPYEPLAIGSAGNVYLASATASSDFPATANALERPTTLCGSTSTCVNNTEPYSEPFIAKFSPDLSQLLYASEVGGTSSDDGGVFSYPVSIHLDSQGDIWTVGTTGDTDFPVTDNALFKQINNGNKSCGIVAAIKPVYLSNNSTTSNTICYGNSSDEYISELSADGSKLLYGSYLGGADTDTAGSASWDSKGDIWIAGYSNSPNYPVTPNALQGFTGYAGIQFATITELTADATKILYSTYFGGGNQGYPPNYTIPLKNAEIESPSLVAVDAEGNIHLAGVTESSEINGSNVFPLTDNAFQTQFADGNVNGVGADFGNDMYYAILGSGTVSSVRPSVGGNTGDATVTISGTGFQQGATCTLIEGGTTITSSASSVSPDGTSITCTFALGGVQPGSYTVQVNNPDGTSSSQNNAFNVQNGGGPDIWMNIVSRPTIRTGFPSTLTIDYGNSGTVDAYFVPLTLYLPPHVSASYFIGVPSGENVSGDTANTSSYGSIIPLFLPHVAAGSSGSFVITIRDNVPNDAYIIAVGYGHPWYTSVSTAIADLNIKSSSFTPQQACAASSSGQPEMGSCLGEYLTGLQATGLTVSQVEGAAGSMTAMLEQSQVGPAAEMGGTTLPASSLNMATGGTLTITKVPASAKQVALWITDASQNFTEPVNSTDCPLDGGTLPSGIKTLTCTFTNISAPLNQFDTFAGAAQAPGGYQGLMGKQAEFAVACFATSSQVTGSNFSLATDAGDCGDIDEPEESETPDPPEPPEPEALGDPSAAPCSVYVQDVANNLYDYSIFGGPMQQSSDGDSPCSPENKSTFPGQTVQSYDPNGIIGSNGDGSVNHYVRGTAGLPYEIYFENQPSAAAPAAQVVVTDQLDPTRVNLSTLALGPIVFGSNVITPPSGVTNYATTYSLSSTLSVRVQGSLNPSTGLLKWTFTSIDPRTGLPPTDPTVGFLPPDTNGVSGQGSVQFTVLPTRGQPTGTQITNMATVVFDANAQINTPTWTNTLDVNPPVSRVTPLPATEQAGTGGTVTFTVNWSGTDIGSGIASYTIYVAEDGGTYHVWLSNTTQASASYTGSVGHTYAFYSIAMDRAGNVEAPKLTGDTATQILGAAAAATTTTLAASVTSVNVGGSVTLTAQVSAVSGTSVPTGSVTFMDGTNDLSTVTLNSTGKAIYTTAGLIAGTHSITAQYSGDTNNAKSISSPVSITVGQAVPTVAWPPPASITYGTALSATQLDAAATYNGTTVAGTFTYIPAAGTILTAGPHTLSVTFTPTDTTDYTTPAAATTNLAVTAAALTITANNATRVYGAANPAFTGMVTGAVHGDSFTERFVTTATQASSVGTYSIVPSATGTSLSNYTVTVTDGSLTITQAATTTALSASANSVTPGQSLTLTAHVTDASAGSTGTPTGTVTFYDGTTALGTTALGNGTASYSTSTLSAGVTHSLTASYSGDTNFLVSSSGTAISVPVVPLNFNLNLTSGSSQTVAPGSATSYTFQVSPIDGAYPGPINFSVSGLPPGATATFSPSSIAANGGAQKVTLTIQTAGAVAMNSGGSLFRDAGGTTLVMGLLLLPLFGMRRRKSWTRMLCITLLLLGTGVFTTLATGCGIPDGFFGQKQQSYTVTVTATSGSVSKTSAVTLNVE